MQDSASACKQTDAKPGFASVCGAPGMGRSVYQARKCLINGARPKLRFGRSARQKSMDGLLHQPVRPATDHGV
jgi:hypothetical protein